MPAHRNDRERNRIYEQAIRLFLERGYANTAYKDIAAACGTTKSTVQHYFPKKELLAERYFREKIDEFVSRAHSVLPENGSSLDLLTCIGLIHFDFLLNDQRGMRLCADLLENRSLTNKILGEEFQCAEKFIKGNEPRNTTMKAQFFIALGGAHDLIYRTLHSGEKLAASTVEYATMLALWLPMGLSVAEIDTALRNAQELTGIQ